MGIFQRLRSRVRQMTGNDPIKHVVVLMFENHSFDQMLGCFKEVYPHLDGIDPNNLRSNLDSLGRKYFQRAFSDTVVKPDPRHELNHILNQLKNRNAGFVSEYESEYPNTTVDDRQRIMDYFERGSLSALHELASSFTICDRWFSSAPGPTWTNRFFVHSGTSKGLVTMPETVTETKYYLHYDQDTIYDRLNERHITWRIYFGDVPQSLVLTRQRHPRNALHYHLMHRFYVDTQGREADFPAYIFIEPNYFKGEQNDDHPSHSTMRAQRLLGQVYNALRANDDLWNSTLLVVLYDEHGGFYDHVEPPSIVAPDQYQDEYSFDRLGVRVPALLVSPWVARGLLRTQFDHTSLLKYLTDKWGLRPLTNRVREANSFADAILTNRRAAADTPRSVAISPLSERQFLMAASPLDGAPAMTDDELAEPINDFQRSLMIFSEHLGQNELAAPLGLTAMMAGPLIEEEAAKKRIEAFLTKQKTGIAQ